MKTVDYLENYLNGDDDYTQDFESFHVARQIRKKSRHGEGLSDRRQTRPPKNRTRRLSSENPDGNH